MTLLQSVEISTVLTVTAAVSGALIGLIYLVVILLAHTPRAIIDSERTYKTCADDETPLRLLESKSSNASLKISIIVPCYNETERLSIMLDEAMPHLQDNYKDDWEILIVDDGSRDGTASYALDWVKSYNIQNPSNPVDADRVRVCVLAQNRGKGGAVSHGMQFFRGQYAIFVDADGASRFADLDKLLAAVESSDTPTRAIAIGSRAHMVNTSAVVKRSLVRNFLMHGLHALVYVFGIRDIADTQCGFKLLSRQAALEIFPNMRTERWIFDVEVLIRGRRKGIPVFEVPISWHEVGGSKLDLATDSVLMAVDLVIMRFAFFLGVYKDNVKNEKSD